MHDTPPATSRILVWDLPVRLFHWMLAIAFAGAWVTADSERWRDVHILLGYTAGVVVVLRSVWGLVGTRATRHHQDQTSTLSVRATRLVTRSTMRRSRSPQYR